MVARLEDSLVKEYTEVQARIDNDDAAGLSELVSKYDIKNPSSGNKFSLPVYTQNLMFPVAIGAANVPAYLRPESAQGQFFNFNKLLEFNQLSIPFASASIGKSGRNQIAPRAGLLRVREFLMAEIERETSNLAALYAQLILFAHTSSIPTVMHRILDPHKLLRLRSTCLIDINSFLSLLLLNLSPLTKLSELVQYQVRRLGTSSVEFSFSSQSLILILTKFAYENTWRTRWVRHNLLAR